LNTDLREVVMSSAIGDGANLKWVDRDYSHWNDTDPRTMSSLRRIQNYISTMKPPPYPLVIDATLAAAGATVFQTECATCHAFGGARTGTLIDAAEVGTDPHRIAMWTPASAAAYNAYGDGHPWKFSHFEATRDTRRCHSMACGSVHRTCTTDRCLRWRICWNPSSNGRASSGAATMCSTGRASASTRRARKHAASARRSMWPRPGNSNAGHTYGTTLPANQKRALLEYLKSL
jgi:hypothetical protein